MFISGHNRETLNGLSSMEQCRDHCLSRTSWTCLSFEYHPSSGTNQCRLSDKALGMVGVDTQSTHQEGDSLYVRQCLPTQQEAEAEEEEVQVQVQVQEEEDE